MAAEPLRIDHSATTDGVVEERPAYDRILADYGFGRAHHRVLHFVDRRPGLTIAELLDILKITKQSLNRVLKELIGKGFVESRTGTADRRQRLLFTTPDGHELALRLAKLQTRRIMRALADGPPGLKAAAGRFLFAMIDPADRPRVEEIVGGEILEGARSPP